MRVFVGFPVSLNEEIRSTINYYKKRFPQMRVPRFFHITLSFLGEQYNLDYIVNYFKDKQYLDVELKGVNAFPSLNKARVLWIGANFSYNIMAQYKLPKNDIFHLTIGRLNFVSIKENPFQDTFYGKFTVKEIFVYNSDIPGKKYSILEKVALKPV